MRVADTPVCRGHSAPIEFLAAWILDQPAVSLVLGPRGGGKSFLSALETDLSSVRYDRLKTKILGGSLSQSGQIYDALEAFDHLRPRGRSPLTHFSRTKAAYCTGSEVSILAASSTSVRGPHVPRLKLDEVDEIDPAIRNAAMGMCMGLHGVPAMCSMTSTWHRVGGPMGELVERGRAGEFPLWSFCIFEVLERCPESRSGRNLEKCPDCPLIKWCHAEFADGLPKAKRSNGHYPIESLIQKVKTVSLHVFEADYLCAGPRADGVWFAGFEEASNVSADAEFDPRLPVFLSIDSGVSTGAVWFQLRDTPHGQIVTIFADYFAEGLAADANAVAILGHHRTLCGSVRPKVSTDSAGGARNPVGDTVLAEYAKAGLGFGREILQWPKFPGCVTDGLSLIEAFVRSADGTVSLLIHPRCRHLIAAFRGYERAKLHGQWQDAPKDPQHPHEELIDSLRGGLKLELPEGRKPKSKAPRVQASRLI